MINQLLVVVVTVLGSLAVLWFFKIRRLMIERQRFIVAVLEDFFKPRDKNYTLLGYLVGFKADYIVSRNGVKRVWILYTMPPHHVLLYTPFIKAIGERERLSVTIKLDGTVASEAHVLDPSDRSAKRSFTIDYGGNALNYCGPRADGLIACGSPSTLDAIDEVVEEARRNGIRVVRVSVDREANVVHGQAVIEGADPRPFLRGLLRLARRVTVK